MLLFFSEKNQNLLDIQEHCFCKLGKIRSELKPLFGVLLLIFKVVYWDHLTELLPFAKDFIRWSSGLIIAMQQPLCLARHSGFQWGASLQIRNA